MTWAIGHWLALTLLATVALVAAVAGAARRALDGDWDRARVPFGLAAGAAAAYGVLLTLAFVS